MISALTSPSQRNFHRLLIYNNNDHPTLLSPITPHSPYLALFSTMVIIPIWHYIYLLLCLYYVSLPRIESMAFALSLSFLSILKAYRKPKASSFLGLVFPPGFWILPSFKLKLCPRMDSYVVQERHRMKVTEE